MSLVKKAQNNNEFNFEDLSQAKDKATPLDLFKSNDNFKVYKSDELRPDDIGLNIGLLRQRANEFMERNDDVLDTGNVVISLDGPQEDDDQLKLSVIDVFDGDEIYEDDNEENEDVDSEEDSDPNLFTLEVDEEDPDSFVFHLPKLPGMEGDDEEEEDEVEIEEDLDVDEVSDNVEEIVEFDKWDWEGRGLSQFIPWLHGMINSIPKYQKHETSGMERAHSYLHNLDSIISKALRKDGDGVINISKLEDARKTIRDGISRLEDALEKEVNNRKRKKASTDPEYMSGIVKNAQKISGVNRTTITVDILLARVAKVCINGAVSAGKDIEDLFKRQVEAYDLNIREQASVLQLLEEMGYPIRRDRGILPGEDIDPASEDNFDWMASYQN